MNLRTMTIQASPGEYESLALALRAVAAAQRVQLDYDDLCAGLGVSFAAVSATAESSPAWWLTFGRDVFLEPTGRLFGFYLRRLHPPCVGVSMLEAEEFGQHFEHSYKPLILAALENNQPVLVWRGWPGTCAPLWGLITTQVGGELAGSVMWAEGRQQLVEPALQGYVIEDSEPDTPARDQLWAMAMKHADGYMNRAPLAPPPGCAEQPEVVTGPAAFDAWEDWLASGDFGDPCEDPSWNEHRQHAEWIVASRLSAARFLRQARQSFEPRTAETIGEAVACCESLAARLADSCDEITLQELFATRQGRQGLLESLHIAEADDRRLAMLVEELAG